MSSIVDTPYSPLTQPASGWQLFKNLALGKLTPGLAWQNPAYRRKFVLRSLAAPVTTSRLLTRLAKQPRLMQILQAQPGLPCRMHRPWLTVNMERQHALESLSWHYQTMSRQLPATLLQGYLSKQGATLLTLTGKDEQHFTIRLCADAFMDKEGEATLVFCDDQNTVLAEITFTLCPFAGKSTLFIGGLQGAKAHVPHERIQNRLLPSVTTPIFIAAGVTARKKRENCWLIMTASGSPSAVKSRIAVTLCCRLSSRVNRWKRSRAKNVPNIAVATNCWTA